MVRIRIKMSRIPNTAYGWVGYLTGGAGLAALAEAAGEPHALWLLILEELQAQPEYALLLLHNTP